MQSLHAELGKVPKEHGTHKDSVNLSIYIRNMHINSRFMSSEFCQNDGINIHVEYLCTCNELDRMVLERSVDWLADAVLLQG